MQRSVLIALMATGLVGCASPQEEADSEVVMESISSGKADEGWSIDPDRQYGLEVEEITVNPDQIDFDLADYNLRTTVGGATSGICPASLRCDFTDEGTGGRLTRDGDDRPFEGRDFDRVPVRLH